MDKNKHKLYMAQILGLIFKDKDLCNVLAFKGGTSLMFFHNLNRFSTDLDFNLLDTDKLDLVYDKVRAILTRFGKIDDEAKKLYGPVLVLNYGKGEVVYLTAAKLYSSTYTNTESKTITGEYYLYDGKERNGRYRVTVKPEYCGNTPAGKYVTGYVDKNDMR